MNSVQPFTTPLQTEGLTRSFGECLAVDKFNLELMSGQITVLLGPNGCGKTTLLRMLCGLLRPDAGVVRVFSKRLRHPGRDAGAVIGYCPQHFSLWPDLNCLEQLHFMADMHGVPRETRDTRSRKLMEQLDLVPRSTTLAGKLSGGLKRKLNLALAMINDPRILILDEPFNSLDIASRALVKDLLHSLTRNENRSVLLSTHDIHDAEQFADQVCIMNRGRFVAEGSPQQLKQNLKRPKMVTVQTSDLSPEKAAEIHRVFLERVPGVSFQDDRLAFEMDDLTGLSNVLALLARDGIRVTDITTWDPTLEDVFLQLTGNELTDATDQSS